MPPHNPVMENLLKSTHLYDTEEEDILEMDLPEELGTTVKVSDIMNVNVVTIKDSETIADVRKQMNPLPGNCAGWSACGREDYQLS